MTEEEIQTVESTQETVETSGDNNSQPQESEEVSGDDIVVNITEPITQEEIEATMWDISEAPVE